MDPNQLSSQQSCSSIDSSNLSISSSFDSTQSLSASKQNSNFNKNKDCKSSNKYLSPKQITRFNEYKRQSDLFQSFQQPQPFIGFVGMGKGKQIFIGESKLKRAKQFMEQDDDLPIFNNGTKFNFDNQQESDCKSESTQSIEDIKARSQSNLFKQPQFPQINNFPQFSLGFKCMGTGKAFQISQETNNNVKAFFEEFDKSQAKQTKTKVPITQKRQSEKMSNFIKTEKTKFLNPRQNNNIKNTKAVKRPALNECKKFIQNAIQKQKQKQIKIKLCDMPAITKDQQLKFAENWKQFKIKQLQIKHTQQLCNVKWCYFCQKYKNQIIMVTKKFIQFEVLSILQFKQATKARIPKLIELVIFKLYKFSYFDSNIKNKQFNPNNILLEVYKKCLFYEKEKISPLQCSIISLVASRGKNFGKHINLMVTNIDYSEQMQANFIQLTDGWANVLAVISNTNFLSPFIGKKIIIGSKLEIVNWNLHPISNIIEFHPNKSVAVNVTHCIQFNYNNSMPSPYFSKLGWPKQPFYRPVCTCKDGSAGNIPLVEGIVIRMFTIKNNKNALTNYVQIMLTEGTCILMKVALAQHISLVQIFKLYFSYHFLTIKKLSKNLLEFTPNSKIYEIQDKDRLNKVKQILKSRLFNININVVFPSMKENKKAYIDLVTKSEQLIIDNTKVKIQQKIDGPVLLQQYAITCQPQGFSLSKGDRGSCLRRIPKIYDSLQYNIL